MKTKGHCTTHLCIGYNLLQHPISSSKVVKLPRQWRSFIQPMQRKTSLPTRMTSSKSYFFSETRLLFIAPIPRWSSKTVADVCFPQLKWRNVSVKRRAVAYQKVPSPHKLSFLKDIAYRQILHERYLEPFLTTQGQYKAQLKKSSLSYFGLTD